MKYIQDNQAKDFMENSLESLERTAFIDAIQAIVHANMKHRNEFVHKVCKEEVWNAMIVVYYQKNFYLVETINRKIEIFLSSGIVNHIIGRYVDMRFWNVKPVEKGPSQLSFQHLKGAFSLWAILLAIASFVFSLEVILTRYSQRVLCL